MSKRKPASAPLERDHKPGDGVVVMEFEPYRFALEAYREWRDVWVVVEYAPDLPTAARRINMIARKSGEKTRIVDRSKS